MTTEQVPLAEQIAVVRRTIGNSEIAVSHYPNDRGYRRDLSILRAVLATLQQHERAMAALRAPSEELITAVAKAKADAVRDQMRREGQSVFGWDHIVWEEREIYREQSRATIRAVYAALAALDDAASAAATPAGKGETP